jgi:hypothetical protein
LLPIWKCGSNIASRGGACNTAPGSNPSAAAVSPAWHQAIIRLANAAERACEKLGWVLEHDQDNNPESFYVKNCRELVDMMLDFELFEIERAINGQSAEMCFGME